MNLDDRGDGHCLFSCLIYGVRIYEFMGSCIYGVAFMGSGLWGLWFMVYGVSHIVYEFMGSFMAFMGSATINLLRFQSSIIYTLTSSLNDYLLLLSFTLSLSKGHFNALN